MQIKQKCKETKKFLRNRTLQEMTKSAKNAKNAKL